MAGSWRKRLAIVAGSALVVSGAIGGATVPLARAQANPAFSAVSAPVVTVTTGTAGAPGATYTIGFTATSAIAASGTITVDGPSGTLWPSSQRTANYVLTDTTTPSGSANGVGALRYADSGLSIYNFLNQSGAVVTMTIPNAINAGDHLGLTVTGVGNPAAGSHTLAVRTSGDQSPATSAPYTVAAPGGVSTPTVSVTGPAAGGSDATYAIGFTPATTIAAGGSITLKAPPGTLWPSSQRTTSYVLDDPAHPAADFASVSGLSYSDPGIDVFNFLNASGAVVTMTVPNAIPAGDPVTLTVSGVHNPDIGSRSLAVSTSSDPTLVDSSAYSILAQTAVSQPGVATSSSVAGATGVGYTLTFTTPVALPASGAFMLSAPPGTAWPAGGGDYAVTDVTTPGDSSASASSLALADADAAVTFTVPNAIHAGDSLSLSIAAVTNPGAGSQTLRVSTSTAPQPSTSSSYSITGAAGAPTQVSAASVTPSSTAGGASDLTYAVNFTTSATGALAANTDTVTLAAPPGTIFPTCPYGCGSGNATYTFTDAAHPAGFGVSALTVSAEGSTVEVAPTTSITANDAVTLTVTWVTNPPAGNGSLRISTSADAQAASAADSITTADSVGAGSFSTTSTAGGASGVTDTFDFTASATGTVEAGIGAINLFGATGAVFGSCPYGCGGGNPTVTITDLTSASRSGAGVAIALAGPNSMASIVPDHTIDAGDHVTVSITQVTNPLAGLTELAISTSSDPVRTALAGSTTAAQAGSSPHVTLSSQVAGATGVSYTVSFAASSTGGLVGGLSSISLVADPGTNFGSVTFATINDLSNSSAGGSANVSAAGVGGAAVTITPSHDIGAGDAIAVVLHNVTNGPAGTSHVGVSTSSDPVRTTLPVALGVGHTISGTVRSTAAVALVGASLQACAESFGCDTTTTDGSGQFSFTEVDGTYAVTAYPPDGSSGTATVTVPLTAAGVSGLVITLPPAPHLPVGISLISASHGTADSSTPLPTFNWNEPTELTIDPSVFPATGKVRLEQVVINGTNFITGLPATKVVNVGGSVNGNPIGVPIGTAAVTVQIPPLNPIHGNVKTSLNYTRSTDDNSPPDGMTAPLILDEIYPPAPPSEQPTDPLPAFITNYAYPGGRPDTGPGNITGADASRFSIAKLSTYKVPAGTMDCGDTTQTLEQYDKATSVAPFSTYCGILVQFTPPDNGNRIYYRALLNVPVGHLGAKITVALLGCDARVAAEAGFESCYQGTGGEVKDPDDDTSGGGGNGGTSDGGDDYSDPSGTVFGSHAGVTAPLAGATATLSRSDDEGGPFSTVPNGSVIMSPANRTNPMTTSSQGAYGWDVLSGFYSIAVTAANCSPGGAGPLQVPPPATGVNITLACASLPSRAATSTSLSASSTRVAFSKPLVLTATVHGTPTAQGSVTVNDGTTSLGTAVLVNGNVTLASGLLKPGSHRLTASYVGDPAHQPSTSAPLAVTVTPPKTPLTLNGPRAVPLHHKSHLSGHAALGASVSLFAATSAGRFHKVATKVAGRTTGKFAFVTKIAHLSRYYALSNSVRSATLIVGTNPTISGPHHATLGTRLKLSGIAPPGSHVQLERALRNGHVQRLATAMASRKTGHYRFTLTPTRKQTTYLTVADGLRSRQLVIIA